MFGMGGSEILVILIVALLFLGPDKLPDAAKTISKGIRDLKKQTRVLQETIENDEHIGGAIRDLKSALRGDEAPPRPVVRKPADPAKLPDGAVENQILPPAEADAQVAAKAAPAEPIAGAPEPAATAPAVEAKVETKIDEAPKPAITLPAVAGEDAKPTDDETAGQLAAMIKPAAGTVAKS
jgi:sec-independent protein translocase protein TatB